MFLDNKYTVWYFKIIEKSRTLSRNKRIDYFEAHHIIPRSFGGNNTKDNIVLLTAREHYICHLLLTKMVPFKSKEWYSMAKCIYFFNRTHENMNTVKINSRIFEKMKRNISSYRRETYDRQKDILRRQKISQSMKEKWKNNHYDHLSNIKISEETKQKISESGKKSWQSKSRKKRKDARPDGFTRKDIIYKSVTIQKEGKIKNIKRNQVPQYSKFGWKMVDPTGFEPVSLSNQETYAEYKPGVLPLN